VQCLGQIFAGPGAVPSYDDCAFALTWGWCGGLINWLQFDLQLLMQDRETRSAVYLIPLPAPLAWGLELMGPVEFESGSRNTERVLSWRLSNTTNQQEETDDPDLD
jgi:hypothetical protein